MNAMAVFYDPEVSYKNDIIFFSFMNFHENFINLNENGKNVTGKPKKWCVSRQPKALTR